MSASRAIGQIERMARGQIDGVKRDYTITLITASGLRYTGKLLNNAGSDGFIEMELAGGQPVFLVADLVETVWPNWVKTDA